MNETHFGRATGRVALIAALAAATLAAGCNRSADTRSATSTDAGASATPVTPVPAEMTKVRPMAGADGNSPAASGLPTVPSTPVAQRTVNVVPDTSSAPAPAISAPASGIAPSVPTTGPSPSATASLPAAGSVGPGPASAPDNQPPSVSPGSKS